MTEDDARGRVAAMAGEAMPQVEHYAAALIEENGRQNLIARSTEPVIWSRHIFDSAQLANYVRPSDRLLLDVGSGAGLPGIVLALIGPWSIILVEPRRRRVEFLSRMVSELALERVKIIAAGAETIRQRVDLVTARAVAPSTDIFDWAQGCADEGTRFVLPKGRSAHADMDLATQRWQGLFHVEQSLTDPEAGIVIADRVSRR